ncbi:hypothetical protein, partial [Salmonella sp. s51228]|uniref:hypothetical protein n=1 Tax=Salmonella sp. s51228 TaxID=3159652 RepID=UPI00397FBBE7
MILEAASDRLLIILTICAFASIILNLIFSPNEERPFAWIDGAAIFAAVLIVITVGVANDWIKERQFQALNKKLDQS